MKGTLQLLILVGYIRRASWPHYRWGKIKKRTKLHTTVGIDPIDKEWATLSCDRYGSFANLLAYTVELVDGQCRDDYRRTTTDKSCLWRLGVNYPREAERRDCIAQGLDKDVAFDVIMVT